MFIPENDRLIALKRARAELKKRHWDFIAYEDKSTLIEERIKKAGGKVWEAYQYAKQGKIFFHVFHEHFGVGNQHLRPIRPIRITEKFMDKVISDAGGRRLTVKEKADGKKNADYLLGEFIFELKDIQEEGLEKGARQQKLAKLFAPYFPEQSEITIDSSILSKADYLKYLDIMSGPIKSHIKSASKQIKETREILGEPNLKGGIILLNTGFGTFPHDELANQAERFARKDSRQFTAIVSISIWSYTNGFDTDVYYRISPRRLFHEEVCWVRDSFDKLFEEMMTNVISGKISDSSLLSDPLKPVTFCSNEIDFNWSPPRLLLPWKMGNES